MGYQAVIFDMDGTILNTLGDLTDGVNAMLTHLGYPEVSLQKVRQSVGNGVGVLIEKTLPEGRANSRYQQAMAYYRAYYESHCQCKTAPYPGILPLLDELTARGVKLAVVSNKQDAAVQPLTRAYFGGRFALAMGEAPGLRRKPQPDMVWAAQERLGVARSQCLYVGDSEVDVAVARHAGVDCCAVTWGFREEALLAALGPRYLIRQPEELLGIVTAP